MKGQHEMLMSTMSTMSTTGTWRPETPYRLVLVEWENSECAPERDVSVGPVKCISAGFLISETADTVVLAPNLNYRGLEPSWIMRITRSAVRKLVDL
jgi:hypothetical protein